MDKGKISEYEPYVLVSPHGLAYVGLHNSEADCWKIALGYPDEVEINDKIKEGYYVAKANLTWSRN